MEEYLKKLVELNIRLLKRLASEDIEMLKEIIALENGLKPKTVAEEPARQPIPHPEVTEIDLTQRPAHHEVKSVEEKTTEEMPVQKTNKLPF